MERNLADLTSILMSPLESLVNLSRPPAYISGRLFVSDWLVV